MNNNHRLPGRQNGFTIIELMIATSILSVILLLATALMINIGTLYYKGYNQAHIQDAVRGTLDQVTQGIQTSNYGGTSPVQLSSNIDLTPSGYAAPVSVRAYCIGTVRYTFVINAFQLKLGARDTASSPQQIPHMLWRDTIGADKPCLALDLSQTNPEVIGGGSLTPPGATGADGQELVPPNSRLTQFNITPLSCGSNNACKIRVAMVYGDVSLSPLGLCSGGTGDQFCAVDDLTSYAAPRQD